MLGAELLKGDLVYLDAIDRDDMDVMAPWWRNIDMTQYLSEHPVFPMTKEDEMEWYDAQRKDKNTFVFAVRRASDDQLMGSTSLFEINWRIRRCLFGISLGDPSVWGKGYGTDATKVMLRYAFQELNLNRVELRVYEFNPRGLRAYEKAGFQVEGRLREAVYREGRYFDEVVMGVLRRDWEEARRRSPAERTR